MNTFFHHAVKVNRFVKAIKELTLVYNLSDGLSDGDLKKVVAELDTINQDFSIFRRLYMELKRQNKL